MLNVLSLFSGIGAFEKALDNCHIPYNLVNYCEIDKYASKSYSAIHGVPESKNLVDVTTISPFQFEETVDLITYGFPCQDISLAGKQAGFADDEGNKTRSGLFFDAARLIKFLQPKFAIAENVKNLVSKKFKSEFETVLETLSDANYNNYYAVLNAEHFGIPQNDGKFLVREATKKGYAEAVKGDSINLEQPNIKTRRGRVGHGVAQTLTTSPHQVIVPKDLRIRKLTPKECFRLMGFDDEDFYKAESINSNTQLYKQAGNSIVVKVLEALYKSLGDTYEEFRPT